MRSIAEYFVDSARTLLNDAGVRTVPVDPFRLAPFRRITQVVRKPAKRDGILVPNKCGFVVAINDLAPIVRQRFAMAHEIGHTFLFDLREDVPRLTQARQPYWTREGLCHLAAEEILLPHWDQATVERDWLDPSIRRFLGLMQRYQVSADVLAHRLRRLNISSAVVIIWTKENGGNLKSQAFAPKRFSGKGYHRVPPPLSVRIAASTHMPSLSTEEFVGASSSEHLYTESVPLDPSNSRILTIVYPELGETELAARRARLGEQIALPGME